LSNSVLSPRVSVLISTKNRERLISRAIDSVLAQSFKDFELIITDVSDNDLTQEIVSHYQDARVRYFKIDNEISVAKTVNEAIFKAKGEYIAFCDDDDEWCSAEKLSQQVALLDFLGTEYGFVSCGWEIWNDRTNKHICYEMPKAKGDVFLQMLVHNVALGTPTLLIRKDAYVKVGGFEESLRYSADHLLLTKLSELYKFDFVPEIMVLGHQFHDFGSSQYLVKRSFRYKDKMMYFVNFLERFGSTYDSLPSAKRSILERILTMAAKEGDTSSFIKYSQIYLGGDWGFLFILKRIFILLRNALIKYLPGK